MLFIYIIITIKKDSQYARQMLTSITGEINSNTKIVGDFIPHSHLWIDQLKRKLARKHKL